ncbi:MAG: DEAD/DEAH box helicase family protein [bacterium]
MERIAIRYDRGSLVVEGVPEGWRPPSYLVWDDRIGAYRSLAIHHRALVRHLTHAGSSFRDEARAYPELRLDPSGLPEPFPHQRAALEAWSRGKWGIVEMPTGSGKTLLALRAICTVQRGTLILVPTLELLAQWCGVLETHLGLHPGVIGGGSHQLEPVTVCTYASAYRKGEHFGNRFCLVVFDECHHLAGAGYARIADGLIAPYRLGLSATIETAPLDGVSMKIPARRTPAGAGSGPIDRPGDGTFSIGEALKPLTGPVVYRASIAEMRGGVLAPYRVETLEADLSPRERADYEEARGRYRNFAKGAGIVVDSAAGWKRFVFAASRTPEGRQALEAFYRQRRIAFAPEAKFEALADILSRHRDSRVLIFTNDNTTAYEVSRRFLLPIITHQTKVSERRVIMERFRGNRWPFLVTSRVLNEGVDVPEVNVAVVLSGTASVREHVQRLGRILRKAPGKEAVLYEVLSRTPVEQHVSRRRRMHEAYR